MSPTELALIEDGKHTISARGRRTIPYRAMLRDKAVWGLVISDIGNVFGLFIFMYYGPTYLNKVSVPAIVR